MRSGAPLKQVAVELGVSEQTLRNWRRQGDIDAGRADGLTTDEREELRRLRRENRRLTQEREILKAAAAFLARERPIAGDVPPADRREEGTASRLPAVQRARRLARRLLRLEAPAGVRAAASAGSVRRPITAPTKLNGDRADRRARHLECGRRPAMRRDLTCAFAWRSSRQKRLIRRSWWCRVSPATLLWPAP